MFQAQEQEQLELSSSIQPENIFNSESSSLACSNIPQISSVHSFMGAKSSPLGDVVPNQCSLLVDLATVTSLDQPIHGSSSYKLSSTRMAISSSKHFSVESPTEADSASSLETPANCKRWNFQAGQQSEIENFNLFPELDPFAPAFLTYCLPLFRGRSSGGNNRPPKKPLIPGTQYVAAILRLENSTLEDMCLPIWNENELKDNRRIIRIERRQQYDEIVASFSIVGSATENPCTKTALDLDVEVLEVSCLQCLVNYDEIYEKLNTYGSVSQEGDPDFPQLPKQKLTGGPISCDYISNETSIGRQYYITSVEVIKIVELLIGSHLIQDRKQKRKERGCIRSNLMPFWSKHLVTSSTKDIKRHLVPGSNDDYIADLAHRIKTYEVRRPRIVNKDLRILEWSNLGSALQRALQSYYVAVSLDKSKTVLKPANGDLIYNIQ
ncbi:BA75_03319T0 [Komagataella pastoris]|uniref:BA75_03319T0 n=1 Tax=Komagataella pastoris TaxID=4922 RepID=A0A1B2JD47_PICPA|nr:BA75_03319T0 [Komagataella pastoris]